MKLRNLCMAACALVALSCSDDAENRSLNGTWYLTNTTASDGSSLSYSKGDVIWSFNEKSGTLTIKNTVTALSPVNNATGLASGGYHFTVKTVSGIQYLYIDDVLNGAIATTGDNLVLNGTNTVKVFRR